jgi:hypothetical protein
MANSKLLKEAIADAKAVKETALANAKLALEEAFTPRLQSMLTQKLRAEAEMEGDEEQVDEELSSDGIGSKTDVGYPETPGATPNLTAQTDLSVGVAKDGGKPEQSGTDYKKVADINEEDEFGMESEPSEKDAEIAELKARLAELEGEEGSEEENPFAQAEGEDEMGMDDMGMDSEMGGDSMDMGADEESEDDMDLEAIIRELEAQLGDDEEGSEEAPAEENPFAANENLADGSEAGTDKGEDPKVVVTNEAEGESDEVDLEEILREMEADMKGDEEKMDEAEESEKEAELEEAYTTIKSLQRTINEVNLLNAKLLFANKLFRAHNMTNEQKIKVIETLDRTKSVREVKLVFSTLAENFKYTSINKNAKKTIKEGIASKVVKSTKPAVARTVISESAQISDRFKKLAGIIK